MCGANARAVLFPVFGRVERVQSGEVEAQEGCTTVTKEIVEISGSENR
jgi:hypothetical protein